MPTSFQEFLRQKVEGSDWRDRKRLRDEWLSALQRLLDQIRAWLRESDPEGVLECVTYEVQRVEERLGVYDAPALTIRLNTESADVLPMGRFTHLPQSLGNFLYLQGHQDLLFINGNQQRWSEPLVPRVDITNGERRHQLLLSTKDGLDCWYAWLAGQPAPIPFDRATLEMILKDLLS